MTNLKFDPKTHTYSLNNNIIPSVTQVMEDLLPSFKVHEWYLKRGSAVHQCAALIAQGKKFKNDPRIDGQVVALYKFFNEVNPQPVSIETPVYSERYQYAGTLDLLMPLGDNWAIIDYKGTVDKERTAIQIAGYGLALDEMCGTKHKYGYGVQINDDGTYSMTERIRLETYKHKFLSLLNVYKLRDKLGYHKNEKK